MTLWQEREQTEAAEEEQLRIYLATNGLTSPHTKRAYRLAFNHFIKTTVKNKDLRILLDTKQNAVSVYNDPFIALPN